MCGDESSIVRFTQIEGNWETWETLDTFQIVGDRAIWRFIEASIDMWGLPYYHEAYYFNSFHGDGDQYTIVRITQVASEQERIYHFQAGAGGRPNRVVWRFDDNYRRAAYYYTCLPGGFEAQYGMEIGIERITQVTGEGAAPRQIMSFNVNGDIASWFCIWGDGQVTNHSKTLLSCELLSCDSAGVEKN